MKTNYWKWLQILFFLWNWRIHAKKCSFFTWLKGTCAFSVNSHQVFCKENYHTDQNLIWDNDMVTQRQVVTQRANSYGTSLSSPELQNIVQQSNKCTRCYNDIFHVLRAAPQYVLLHILCLGWRTQQLQGSGSQLPRSLKGTGTSRSIRYIPGAGSDFQRVRRLAKLTIRTW